MLELLVAEDAARRELARAEGKELGAGPLPRYLEGTGSGSSDLVKKDVVEVPAGFRQDSGVLATEDKSKAANPSELAAILTVALRPQWELKAGFQRLETSPYFASKAEKIEPVAIVDVESDATQEAETRRAEPERSDPDEALRWAIKAALDVGDYGRVRALLAVLESSPRPAPILTLASRMTPP